MTDLQNKPIIIGTPVGIGKAVNEIREALSNLPWIDFPFFIAEKFHRTDTSTNKTFIYPETYAPTKPGRRDYARLTPDNDYLGMFFFLVGDSQNEFEPSQQNFINYPVSIIFSVNLDLIDSSKLNDGLFTDELMRDARRILTDQMINFDFSYSLTSETKDLQKVFQEFRISDLEQYNRAPMQCFRFNLNVQILEDCI